MASEQTLSSLVAKLQDSIESTITALPSPEDLAPPDNGISLLDTKADLFLSYLQNLAFLILVKLRKHKHRLFGQDDAEVGTGSMSEDELDAAAVKKLVELRIYLEKGVRPLEGRLKYQIDTILRAADTAKRAASSDKKPTQTAKQSRLKASTAAEEGSEDDDGSGESDDGSEGDMDGPAYSASTLRNAMPSAASARHGFRRDKTAEDGIYRPPKITPTAMPTTDIDGRAALGARPVRSAAVDDYVASELTTAPTAEPSIGSGISAGGRTTTNARDRARADERREYEEANFIRLPRESKKERAKQRDRVAARGGGAGEFDLSGLSAMGDRVARATAKKASSGGKRARDAADGPRGDGHGTGFKEKKKRKY